MNPYLLISVWSKIRNIFQYFQFCSTPSSWEWWQSQRVAASLLYSTSFSSWLRSQFSAKLFILFIISFHFAWKLSTDFPTLTIKTFAEEARRKGSPQRHFYVQKFLWWSSCCLQEKGQWPSVNAQNLVLSSLSCLQLKWNNGKSSFLTKFMQWCCHDDHCDLPSLPVHLGCQVSTCIWLNCYCWGNSSMVEGRYSKWF